MGNKLSHGEIADGLTSLPGWSRNGETIERQYQFPNFVVAMSFIHRVAELAEEANHHPDIDIRYNKVRLALTSHDSGGVTARDLKMAKKLADLDQEDARAAG
jgi:4a-hydroxytetrahydrobiopterin dehydratase